MRIEQYDQTGLTEAVEITRTNPTTGRYRRFDPLGAVLEDRVANPDEYQQLVGEEELDRESRMRALALNAIATLEGFDANWATMTNAQRTNAQQVTIRILAKLLRVTFRRLEAE